MDGIYEKNERPTDERRGKERGKIPKTKNRNPYMGYSQINEQTAESNRTKPKKLPVNRVHNDHPIFSG